MSHFDKYWSQRDKKTWSQRSEESRARAIWENGILSERKRLFPILRKAEAAIHAGQADTAKELLKESLIGGAGDAI